MGDIETASFRSGSDGGTVHKSVRLRRVVPAPIGVTRLALEREKPA